MKSLKLYEYKTESGDIVEMMFPMGEAPESIVVDGKEAKRTYGSIMTHIPDHMRAVKKK